MIRKITIGIAVTLIFLAGACTARHPGTGPHGDIAGRIEKHLGMVLDKLDATPEQRDKITGITETVKQEAGELRAGIKKSHRAMFEDLMSDNPDAPALHSRLNNSLMRLGNFSHRMLDHLIRISRILEPEQREKLVARYKAAHGN